MYTVLFIALTSNLIWCILCYSLPLLQISFDKTYSLSKAPQSAN